MDASRRRVPAGGRLAANNNEEERSHMSWIFRNTSRKVAQGILASLILLGPVNLFAQRQFLPNEVFVGFSDLSLSSCCQRVSFWGWQAGAGGEIYKNIGLKADFGGQYKKLGDFGLKEHQFLLGPELRSHRETVNGFGHVLFGGVHVSCGDAPGCISQTGFSMGVGGGVDVNVAPRIALRFPQFDWIPSKFDGQWSKSNVRLGFGIVYKIAGR